MQYSIGLAADSKICFDKMTIAKIGAELDYCDKVNESNTNLINTLKQKEVDLFNLSEAYRKKLDMVAEDKKLHQIRGDKFEKEFDVCTKDLADCNDSKPSRLVWFSSGVMSTMALILISVIALK